MTENFDIDKLVVCYMKINCLVFCEVMSINVYIVYCFIFY